MAEKKMNAKGGSPNNKSRSKGTNGKAITAASKKSGKTDEVNGIKRTNY